jgi:hypothetical protein
MISSIFFLDLSEQKVPVGADQKFCKLVNLFKTEFFYELYFGKFFLRLFEVHILKSKGQPKPRIY